MVRLAIVLGDRGPDCENSKEPILLAQYRGSALQLLRVKSGVFLFFFFLTKIISF